MCQSKRCKIEDGLNQTWVTSKSLYFTNTVLVPVFFFVNSSNTSRPKIFSHRLLGDNSSFRVNVDSRLRAMLNSTFVSFSDIRLWHHGGNSKLLRRTLAGSSLVKVNNGNSKAMCEICSKLTIKTPE